MANNQIVVDPIALENLARQFATKAEELAGVMSDVNNELNAMEPLWKGPAKTQFDTLMVQWGVDFRNIQELLKQVATLVDQAQIGYTSLDADIARHFH